MVILCLGTTHFGIKIKEYIIEK
ncbi:hypothetical protein DSAG12_04230 [Promethearchaeum syntrophicum]|uniref:Uncharacterized protein n=1 Tax=Promethearchaeum syntrophicum TaxID=2594042 RepID=A0AC61ZTZ7_9ARCH